MQIRPPAPAGPGWLKRGTGLGGLAVAAVLGWAALREPLPHGLPPETEAAAIDAPASETSATEASATEAAAPDAPATEPPPSRLATAQDLYPEEDTPTVETAESVMPAVDVAAASPEEPPPSPDDAGAEAARSVETSVRLEKGDTLGGVLRELGFAKQDVADAIASLSSHVSMKRLPAGQAMTVKMQPADDGTGAPTLLALTIRPEPRREITLEREDDGDYSVDEEVFETVSKRRRAAGPVDGSVIASAEAAGLPRPALAEMLRAFSWDVNFQHDIKVGDRFDVLIEQSWTSDGQAVDGGRVLWAELTTGGGERSTSIYRFKPRDGEEFFFTGQGESVVKALLRTPLNMSRISSSFGMRRHPVLRFTRMHAGVDFAAPPGTPVLAAGAGQVVEAGPNGGYGRWVKISHQGGLATGYAHLSRIAPGVRRSARVRQGQVIGFVGSTGLSTGPHLHFELHRNGRPVNPLSVAQRSLRTRLSGEDLARFRRHVAEIDRARDEAAALTEP